MRDDAAPLSHLPTRADIDRMTQKLEAAAAANSTVILRGPDAAALVMALQAPRRAAATTTDLTHTRSALLRAMDDQAATLHQLRRLVWWVLTITIAMALLLPVQLTLALVG